MMTISSLTPKASNTVAQGTALGWRHRPDANSPERAKRSGHIVAPFQGYHVPISRIPRALPWALVLNAGGVAMWWGTLCVAIVLLAGRGVLAADNRLTDAEKRDGWILLFDGHSLDGWITSSQQPSRRPVEDHAINPHKCGGYMMIHQKPWGDFVLALDFKISPHCNSGVFLRTWPLEPRPGKDVGFNGIEVAIEDTTTAGYHDTGAIYDLVPPETNAMKPAGQWNHMQVTCDKNLISVELNGTPVSKLDLDQWTVKNKRPDGSDHKFDIAFKDHPRSGYLGVQDHGGDCWFKNIKLKPVTEKK